MIENFSIITYSFQMFTYSFLYAAGSITISDWAAALHDIGELKSYPWIVRRSGLFALSVIFFCISVVMVVFFCLSSSVDDFVHSRSFLFAILLQASLAILLVYLMIYVGSKLCTRIHGAAGSLGDLSSAGSRKTPRSRSDQLANQLNGSIEFRSALRNLWLVMATCTLCLVVKVTALSASDQSRLD